MASGLIVEELRRPIRPLAPAGWRSAIRAVSVMDIGGFMGDPSPENYARPLIQPSLPFVGARPTPATRLLTDPGPAQEGSHRDCRSWRRR